MHANVGGGHHPLTACLHSHKRSPVHRVVFGEQGEEPGTNFQIDWADLDKY